MGNTFVMAPFDHNYQNIQSRMMHFLVTLTVSEIIEIFYLEKVGQGHGA